MTKGRILLGRILFSPSKQLIALARSLVVGCQGFASGPFCPYWLHLASAPCVPANLVFLRGVPTHSPGTTHLRLPTEDRSQFLVAATSLSDIVRFSQVVGCFAGTTSEPVKQPDVVKLKDRNGATGSERPQNSVAFMLLRLGGELSSINQKLRQRLRLRVPVPSNQRRSLND